MVVMVVGWGEGREGREGGEGGEGVIVAELKLQDLLLFRLSLG